MQDGIEGENEISTVLLLLDITVKDYINKAIEKLNISDASAVRKFMRSYGTHYIDSFVTGNSMYQVRA